MQHMYSLEFPGTDCENVHLSQLTAIYGTLILDVDRLTDEVFIAEFD